MNNDDDDKKTEQTTETGPETSETTDTTAAENTETGSESTESGDQSPQGDPDNAGEGNSAANNSGASETPAEGDTFPRAYVEELRQESAGYRTRVRDLEQQLHRLQVEQTGALADPADLPFDASHLESPEALQAAIEELLAAKPHLKARRFAPNAAAQGARSGASGSVDLLGMLRANA